ncbi:hypothetical protein [Hufsiella ginkgonis]|uniref:Uncharacterized protein n=1 Tax=Hufsiella ginkgonis TaxID=2695274 RepID=A0A7K1XXC2_9SPHI|nr:hypothetical protein [Hufsiella ginkgonis]MXV15156.1 hypothetical protein [Hufsiella ginkgonis]
MTEYFIFLKEWLLDLGEDHNVNPFVFGGLYLTSKVFFFSLLGWTIKCFRAQKPFMIILALAFLSFSLPYLYLIIAGENISVWIYVFIASVLSYGAFTIWKKLNGKPVVG